MLNNTFHPKQIYSLSCRYLAAGQLEWAMVLLEQKRGELRVLQQWKEGNDLAQLPSIIPKGIPVILTVLGSGLLHHLKEGALLSDEQLLDLFLPGMVSNDFYFQKIRLAENFWAYSIIKRKKLNDLLGQLEQLGLTLIACQLGVFSINILAPIWEDWEESRVHFIWGNETVFFKNGNLIQYQASKELNSTSPSSFYGNSKLLEQLDLKPKLLLPYAAGLSFYLAQFPLDAFQDQKGIIKKREALQFKMIFKKTGRAFLLVLFLSLLLNFFLLSYFNNKTQRMESQNQTQGQQHAQLSALKEQVEYKKEILGKSQQNFSSRTAYYADQLASSKPENIQLTSLKIFPLKKQKRETRYQDHLIEISGRTRGSLSLNHWTQNLKKMDWLKDLELVKIQEKNNQLYFELKLKL